MRDSDENIGIRIEIDQLTTAVFLTKVWKPPNVAQADAITQQGEEELEGIAPLGTPLTPSLLNTSTV